MSEPIEKYIRKSISWDDLDTDVRQIVSNRSEYEKKVVEYSIRNQFRYRGNLGNLICNFHIIHSYLIHFNFLFFPFFHMNSSYDNKK